MSKSSGKMKPRVLIIDDEEAIDRVFKRMFGNGWEVHTESDPLIARARLLSSEEFDAILLDIVMPNLNGFQLYEELIAKASLRTRRIIFITAAPHIPAVEVFFERHRCVWLEKPFRLPQLEALVHMLAESSFPRGP